MPEHLRALIVVLTLAIVFFAFGKKAACTLAIADDDFNYRRNLWFALTLTAFLAHNFWVFMIVAGSLTFLGGLHERNKLALYFFLFSALPMISVEFRVVNVYLFDMHYGRLLSLTILLPAFIGLNRISQQTAKFGCHVQDIILLAFLALLFLLNLRVEETVGNKIRNYGFYPFLDVFLPYYVASRSLNTLKDFRDALMSLSVACLVLAAIAVFECGRHWLLYNALPEALGVTWGYGAYLARGDFLRAVGTAGQAIALGYELAVAFGIFLFFGKSAGGFIVWRLGLAILTAGMVAALSRGPWVGAVTMVSVFLLTGPRALSNLTKFGSLALVLIAIIAITPISDRVVSYLPFIGTVDAENVEGRKNLLSEGIDIILENPMFGSRTLELEQFRTGEGIIDIVNTYLLIGFTSGLTGLGLFTMFFLTICLQVFKSMQRLPNTNDERHRLGGTLLAVLSGILVIIGTVSSITVIPYIYWSVAGLGVAYIRLAKQTIAQ